LSDRARAALPAGGLDRQAPRGEHALAHHRPRRPGARRARLLHGHAAREHAPPCALGAPRRRRRRGAPVADRRAPDRGLPGGREHAAGDGRGAAVGGGLLFRQPSERGHDRALAAHLRDLALAIDDPDARQGSGLDLPARLLEELACELEVRGRDLEAGGSAMADTIRYQVSDDVAQITLDDGKVNAMALAFFEGLNAALDRAERERPGAVVIAGRAGVFSAGLNLKLLPTLPPAELARTMVAFGRTMLRVFTFPIPTVAAVSGHAIAGGAMLASACDLRFMAGGPFRLHPNQVAIGPALPPSAILPPPAAR